NVYFKNIRHLILERCRVLEIVDFRYGVFDQAVVDCAIIILQKEADKEKRDANQIRVHLNIRSISDIFDESKVVKFKQSFFNDPSSDYRFSIYLEPKINQIVDKMDLCPQRLGAHIFVNRGIGLVSPDGKKKATLFKKEKSFSKDKPVFIGKDITRYVTKWSNNYALVDDTTIAGGTRNEEVHEAPVKLIFPRIRNLKYKQRILASYDDKKIWVLDNYNILRLKSNHFDAKFLLCLTRS
ncbi:MAG TPA: TaqI-like C-terminal specificity domain-containing protein, partial [Nitrososphaera sp.]